MKVSSIAGWSNFSRMLAAPARLLGLLTCAGVVAGAAAAAEPAERVVVGVELQTNAQRLAPRFLGLSYEMSMLLPKDGRYYFDAQDPVLVHLFKTLGIRSLRVGANAVDDSRVAVPQEKDIDELFNFARVAGVKVIYSFRLKRGEPAESARLAAYIAAHYADALDCFCIGNEPNFYLKTFDEFYGQWKPQYDAILKAVPGAMFDGASGNGSYALGLKEALFDQGHLAMASEHFYFLGFGRIAEKDVAATRARFLSNRLHESYQKDYKRAGAVLAAGGVPYRIDEVNSCCDGGAKGASDTYAATLWALDCTHWWATRHILGMNFHTGESVGQNGKFGPPNYAAFLRRNPAPGFDVRPQAYAYLAFSQGARGCVQEVKIQQAGDLDFNAYAYRDGDGSLYLTVINKSFGAKARAASICLQLPPGIRCASAQRLDLVQKSRDVSATGEIALGGAPVTELGTWSGEWKAAEGCESGGEGIQLDPASAAILHFASGETK